MAGDFPITDGTTVVHGADLNAIMKVVGFGSSGAGTPPATGESSGYKVVAASAVVTTNASGLLTVTFPVTFAGAPLVIACSGDNTPAANLTVTLVASGVNTTSFQAYLYSGTTVQNTQTCRINYIAIGY